MSIGANPQSCVIEIGKIPIGLRTGHRGFFNSVGERYAGFLSSSPAEIELEIEITDDRTASDDDVRVSREGSKWHFSRGDFRADWDVRERRGMVRQRASAYALDSVLRILHSLILAERGGFLLHAASGICGGGEMDGRGRPSLHEQGVDGRGRPSLHEQTVDGRGRPSLHEQRVDGRGRPSLHEQRVGRAFLFSGVSGAGKTTITRLAPAGVTVLTDEISYVRPNGDRDYLAFGTPFSGELAKAGENCSAPIAALFFLEKGRENRIEDIPASEAVQRLMRNILFFAEDRRLVENLFATACDLVRKVPVRRLTFYPDSRVWDEVRNLDRMPEHV